MYHLILLFVLVQLAILARYLVYGLFSMTAFVSTFLLLIAALCICFLSKWLAQKEENYQPNNIAGWSFYERQTTILTNKPLFKGNVKRGYIRRYFEKKWQRIVADIVGSNWYLTLELQLDKDNYIVRWKSKNRSLTQEHWEIYKNGVVIGQAYARINIKNTVKLKEMMELTFADKTFTTSVATVSSAIALQGTPGTVGTMKRNHIISNVHVLDVQEDCPTHIVALMLHAYYFKSK
ncbi:hypothetical protein [Metasolibacillus sp.]|uniref:tubby C-terminal domain-like protein n=1 Tax=Metasolibacillus sp. TaxID=2703680 RepID=UPI0025FFB956|nr:hypothetical protein [Metasolibacillus sp.]MCT6924810.1 hypothetical protein [Metasolibacillus sp.]MCT6941078.1 hypothetical protein [Metasolibacillus sp.]